MIKVALDKVRNEVDAEAKKVGRPVRLMAVSKLHPYEAVLEAYDAGQRLFGENHVQEVEEKFPTARPSGMELHMIGHLQGNKVKKIVPLVDAIDSVDSLKLMEKIASCSSSIGKRMPVLLEVNTSGEEAKSGFLSDEELFTAMEASLSLPSIHIYGLMTVGPLGGDDEKTRLAFRKLVSLKKEAMGKFPSLDLSVLSMGMSGDWPIAIEEGSTMVRIGTAIFGEREYPK